MDFSSIQRALESLHRRQPALSLTTTLLYVNELIAIYNNSSIITNTTTTTDHENQSTKLVFLVQRLLQPSHDDDDRERWEPLAVGLYIAIEILTATTTAAVTNAVKVPISSLCMDGPRVPTVAVSNSATSMMVQGSITTDPYIYAYRSIIQPNDCITLIRLVHMLCVQHLEHKEPRLRTLVAKAVGAYGSYIIQMDDRRSDGDGNSSCRAQLMKLLQEMYTTLTNSIAHHIQMGRTTTTATLATTTAVLDDTTEWRAMETNWLCLASLIDACSYQYYHIFPIPESLYQQCAYCAIQHVNRHIRVAAMQTYEQWILVLTKSILFDTDSSITTIKEDNQIFVLFAEPTSLLRATLIDIVKEGLADNWSQVRMAASVLCRTWFTSLQTLQIPIDESNMISALLPRMCLNRFYFAQGVKLYSHETWKLIFGATSTSNSIGDEVAINSNSTGSSYIGLHLLIRHINAMICYYIKMCNADNHTVRQGACQAIAELAVHVGTTIDPDTQELAVQEQEIKNLIAALLMCFCDESWQVRDEACLACGILCKAFPSACYDEIFHKTLWDCFVRQLTDQIWSVRENAAIAIGDVLDAYGVEILPQVQALIITLLPSAKDQPAITKAEYKEHVNDLDQHTDNQLYSCGSLALKLRKGNAGRIGCTNCGIDRPKAPWEATDGCIYLIREYILRRTVPTPTASPSSLTSSPPPITDEELYSILSELVDVCRVRHFPQSDELRSTLWKCLPIMAHAIGKQRFKNCFLELFLDLLFETIESSSSSQLSQHAADQCMDELSVFIGPNLFCGRLDDHQRQIYDRTMQERQMMPKGPMGGSNIFSPFGPPGLFVFDVVPASK